MTTETKTTTVDLGDMGEREATVEFTYMKGYTARLSGPPEDCYEGVDAEVEISAVTVQFPGRTVDILPMMTEEAVEMLTYSLIEECGEADDEPEPDDNYGSFTW